MNTEQKPIPKGLVKPSRAAQLLGVHVNAIYRWLNEGWVYAWRVGGQILVSETEIRSQHKRKPAKNKPAKKRTI